MAELKKQKTYKTVFEMACKELINGRYTEQFAKGGLKYTPRDTGGLLEIPFFDDTITMDLPSFVFKSSRSANISLVTRILIMHYINNATGIPLGGEKVAYGDIPACMHYEPVFAKRVQKPLQNAFGFDRHAFLEAGVAMGGKEEEYGDASFTLFALPKIPITFILWEGDDEFPPSAKVLFDPSIVGYLPFEDIVFIAKLATARILKTAHKLHNDEAGSDT